MQTNSIDFAYREAEGVKNPKIMCPSHMEVPNLALTVR